MPSAKPQILVCLTTVSTREQAQQLAGKLIDTNMAACVQIDGPIESHYRWEGKVCCDAEYRLVIKTSLPRKHGLLTMIREVHPYDQPQIVTLKSTDVDPGYASWVANQTQV